MLTHFLANTGHVHHQAQTCMKLRKDFFADDLLNDKRYGNNYAWMNVGHSCLNNCRARQTSKEEKVVPQAELQQELTAQAIHVRHGEDAQCISVFGKFAAYCMLQVSNITPHHTVREHDTF